MMPVGNNEHQRIDEVSTDTLRYSITRDNWFGIVMHEWGNHSTSPPQYSS